MNKEIFYGMLAIIGGIAIFTLIAYLVGGDDMNVNGQQMIMCFTNKELADKFVNNSLLDKTQYTIVIPCSELDKSKIPEDESGK